MSSHTKLNMFSSCFIFHLPVPGTVRLKKLAVDFPTVRRAQYVLSMKLATIIQDLALLQILNYEHIFQNVNGHTSKRSTATLYPFVIWQLQSPATIFDPKRWKKLWKIISNYVHNMRRASDLAYAALWNNNVHRSCASTAKLKQMTLLALWPMCACL